MGRLAVLLVLVVALYTGSYAGFRQTRQEVWQQDQQTYVMFPAGGTGQALYYIWRPLSRADGALTGMRFHIGPHQ
jgi:hypothetical protein